VNSRLVAAKILVQVFRDGQSLTAALDHAWQASEAISPKDKAFVQALCFGVCRQYHRLEFVLNQLLDKPLKDMDVKALVLVGLYQINYMRVKPHAAVSETVLAAPRKKPWAKSLINALLRSYLRQQDELEAKADQVPVAKFSHPDWLIQQIQQDWPDQADDLLLENNQQPPMVLRVNALKSSADAYLQQLQDCGIAASAVNFCPSALVLERPVAVELLPEFNEGLVSVQDTAAQLAAFLLDVQPGQRVLDLCAAPGGKTAHILENQPALSALVAVDIDGQRVQRVADNLQRLSLVASLITADATKPEQWWDGQPYDRILLDAPCSALGVIRRHPDIKLLRRATDIDVLQDLQRQILQAAWTMLAPGGILLYATCSVLKQENANQIKAFLSGQSDATEIVIDAEWGLAQVCGRQILTGESAMDGFYYAKLRKQ